MDKLWTFLLASAPFLAFLLWVAWWLIWDGIRERRRNRAVARFACQYGGKEHCAERGESGQASAA